MMIPHSHDNLSFSSVIHGQERHITPNPNPNSKHASTINTSKRKRNLPGNPDPDAEVVALSPKSLMAINRFLCEICNKGFQREQNLQLHKRGHNLPWKLKQRTKTDQMKKKVYICPEKSCVHHDPARALGDLTGIKKHFSRKHGEKKWKCGMCSKKYAVISDCKAHSKICGSREYRCDCGTLFYRKDSFIAHRAFCSALSDETAKFVSSVSSPLPSNSILSIAAATNNQVLIQSQLHHSLTRRADLNVNRNQTTFLGHSFTSSDQISLQTNAFALPSPSDLVRNRLTLQGEEGSHQWQLNEYMKNTNILEKGKSNNQEDGITKGNVYRGSNPTRTNIVSLFLNSHEGNLASISAATTVLQKAAQMGSSSSLMTSSIFNNTMPNSNCFKRDNNEEELTRDFLGVEATENMASDSENSRFC